MIETVEFKNDKIGFIGGKFLPLHTGHIYAITEAHSQVDKLYIVLSSSEKRDKELCSDGSIKYIPPGIRLAWLGEAFNDLKNITIIHIDDNQGKNDYDWDNGASRIKYAIPEEITHVFSSEESYKDIFDKNYPNAKHVVIDNHRDKINISATDIRKDPFLNWKFMPDFVRSYFVKKIVIVGTESVGKSTIVSKLSKFYNTNFVHEVGRDYCIRYKNNLTPEMFDRIAMEHFLLQDKLSLNSNKILFVDSEAIITKYYLDMYLNEKSDLINSIINIQKFDLCLFLEPDVKWENDGLRFAGGIRERYKNNDKLKQMFDNENIKYKTISGNYSKRFAKALSIINKFLLGEIKLNQN